MIVLSNNDSRCQKMIVDGLLTKTRTALLIAAGNARDFNAHGLV
jgi:hypothetical protein